MKTMRSSILCLIVLLLAATIASRTGSFQVSALYLWNELDQSVGAY